MSQPASLTLKKFMQDLLTDLSGDVDDNGVSSDELPFERSRIVIIKRANPNHPSVQPQAFEVTVSLKQVQRNQIPPEVDEIEVIAVSDNEFVESFGFIHDLSDLDDDVDAVDVVSGTLAPDNGNTDDAEQLPNHSLQHESEDALVSAPAMAEFSLTPGSSRPMHSISEEENRHAAGSRTVSMSATLKRGQSHDEYCWKCHKRGTEIDCKRCGLAWHKKCQKGVFRDKTNKLIKHTTNQKHIDKQVKLFEKLASVTNRKVCMECAIKDAGLEFNKTQGFLKDSDVDMKRIGDIFYHAITSLSKNKVIDFSCFDMIDYGKHYVFEPMDLKRIRQMCRSFGCTEEFMFSIKLLCHSYKVLMEQKGQTDPLIMQSVVQENCNELLKWAGYEAVEIDQCESCYRNIYEIVQNTVKDVKVMPCDHLHSLVWAPRDNKWWPAKVREYREPGFFFYSEEHVLCSYFGSETVNEWFLINHLQVYSQQPPQIQPIMRKKSTEEMTTIQLNEAIADARLYHHTYWKRYYGKAIALPRTSRVFSLKDLYEKDCEAIRGYDEYFCLPVEDEQAEVVEQHPEPSITNAPKRKAHNSGQNGLSKRVNIESGPASKKTKTSLVK